MKKIKFLVLFTISLIVLNSCDGDDQESVNINYVGFVADFAIGVDPAGNASEDVSVYATRITNFDRTFEIKVIDASTTADPSAYNIASSSITIPAGSNKGSFVIDAIGENINSSGLDVVVVEILSSEGVLVGEPISINLLQVCPYLETILKITFDGYGDETSWELEDSSGTILYSAAMGTYTEGQVNATTALCLSPGSYTFTINDDYGDGLSYPTDGNITITNDGTQLVNIIGDFGETFSQGFTITN
jgi:hypothetical protein